MKQLELFNDRCRQAVADAAIMEWQECNPRHTIEQWEQATDAILQDLKLLEVVPARARHG